MKKISLLIGICAVLIIGCAFTATLIAGQVFRSEPSATISELQAKEIALQDAGEDFNTVTFTRNSLESEHDRVMYRVEFYSDEMSYLYRIDGDTGSIYHREAQRKEHIDSQTDSFMQQPVSSEEKSTAQESLQPAESTEENALKYIGVKRAQEIALKDAGLSRDSVHFEKSSLDQEDGITVYDIHFQSKDMEYEYKVKALDGYILEKEIESEDSEFRNQKKTYDDDDDDDDNDDDDDDDDD